METFADMGIKTHTR